MQFTRIDRSIPLSLWGTESMLEYLRDLRDMEPLAFVARHDFRPAFVQLVVLPQAETVLLSAEYDDDASRKAVSEMVELVEGLGEPYWLWGNAVAVSADEFEYELSITIDTGRELDTVHTTVSVSDPNGTYTGLDFRCLLDW
jgi:hypothetical protein